METSCVSEVESKRKRMIESVENEEEALNLNISPERKKIKIDPVPIPFSIDNAAAKYSTSSNNPDHYLLDFNDNKKNKLDVDKSVKFHSKNIYKKEGEEKAECEIESISGSVNGSVQQEEILINNNHDIGIDWTEEELLSLESAVPSYKYLPRTTLQKIFQDINNRRRNPRKVAKSCLESWFKVASDHYDHNQRLQINFSKIKLTNDLKVMESDSLNETNGRVRKIQFEDKYAYRKFYIDAPPQLLTKECFKNVKGDFSFQWSEEQLEVLDTAIDAFKYNPKAVAKKVHKEVRTLKTEHCSKLQVVKWLENAVDHQSEQISERIETSIKDKLKEVNVEDNYVMKSRSPKLTFSSSVDVREFDKHLPASFVSTWSWSSWS